MSEPYSKSFVKGAFLGGAFVATVFWASIALVLAVGGWWTWVVAIPLWAYAAFTVNYVLRNGPAEKPW